MNTLDLERLKAVVVRLLDEAIAELGSATVPLDDNHYWQLGPEKRFDLTATPKADEVGSLWDDWQMTKDIAEEPTQMSAYSLTEVAPLLDYVGNLIAARVGKVGPQD